MNVDEVLKLADSVLSEWRNAQDKYFDLSLAFINQEDGASVWVPPGNGFVKINTDTTIFSASHYYSYANLARDHKG